MRIAIFGGSFDPVHTEHLRLARAAKAQLALDLLFFVPSCRAPHKEQGAVLDGEDRLRLLGIACEDMPFAEACDFELRAGGTSYTYLTCAAFAERFPQAELFFLVGADMLEDFFTWRAPDEILRHVTLVACGRAGMETDKLHERFAARFQKDFLALDFEGEAVSSTDLRVAIAFRDLGFASKWLKEDCLAYLEERGAYRLPAAEGALGLLTPSRRAHSERVARMACKRARSLGIPEKKALTASMLHDCGKNVPQDSPLLRGFTPPGEVPAPVLHQYTGAYIAEHVFGVTDADILGAVRYHTSGKEDMTALAQLIFLSDMLEEGRSFEGIDALRALFWEDLDRCFARALGHQLAYLRAEGKPIYPLTELAFNCLKTP